MIFKHDFVANLLPSPPVKKNKNRLIFGEVMGKSLVSCFLLTHSVEFVPIVLCCSVAERLSFWTQAQ